MNPWSIYNPRTGEKLKDYHFSSVNEVFEAVETLDRGFKKWKKLSFQRRQEQLMKVVIELEKDQSRLAQCMTDEMGKSFDQSQAEVIKCINAARYLCTMDFKGLEAYFVPNKTYTQSQVVFEPLGVLLSILPWNYPAWQGFRAFFPSLLAGHTILLKHSEITPSAGDLIQSYFERAGLKDLLLHRIFSHDHTEKVLADDRMGGVSITGSVKAGKAIAEMSSRHLKKCVLELGGSDPAIILEKVNLERACKSITQSRLQNAGQVCISIKRVLIPQAQKNEILEKLKQAFAETLEGTSELVGPLAQAQFKIDYNKTITELKKHAELIYEKDFSSKNLNDHTAFVNPCILYFEKNHELLKSTEVFGPGLVVIAYSSLEEAVEIANSTIFGLGASVYGIDLDLCQRVATEHQSQMRAEMLRHLEAEKQKLLAAVPAWRDDKRAKSEQAAITTYAKGLGFTDQELAGLTDHRAVLALRKAWLYDQGKGLKGKQTPKATKQVPAGKPPTKAESTGRERDRALERLKREGSVSAGVAALLARK